jgi:hypothetical protein
MAALGICRGLRNRRRVIAENKRRTAQSEAIGQHIEQQWPEVREAAQWAREARERNHLTDLFFAGRKS